MNLTDFLAETPYINFSAPNIQAKAAELFSGKITTTEKAKAAYEFVRDKIPHTFDIKSDTITAKASDVLSLGTGICHAKANLLAALLRAGGIPAGLCFQRTTLDDDDSNGYVVHCYNAIFLDNHWIKVDARGNRQGVNAQFSLEEPVLAFPCRKEYDEYFFPGIYASPHPKTMEILENASSLQDVLNTIPDCVTETPNILEISYTNTLTPEEFNTLRTAASWNAIEPAQAARGLQNTAFIVCARDNKKAIGMARVITDHGYVAYIADMIVLPQYQGNGIGKEIMSRVMAYINETTGSSQDKYIGLHSAKGKEPFYEKFGFTNRPTDNLGSGMTMWTNEQKKQGALLNE
jgi:GNAT superfamily N-acetyltransferase